jgi:hypothetical protein
MLPVLTPSPSPLPLRVLLQIGQRAKRARQLLGPRSLGLLGPCVRLGGIGGVEGRRLGRLVRVNLQRPVSRHSLTRAGEILPPLPPIAYDIPKTTSKSKGQ